MPCWPATWGGCIDRAFRSRDGPAPTATTAGHTTAQAGDTQSAHQATTSPTGPRAAPQTALGASDFAEPGHRRAAGLRRGPGWRPVAGDRAAPPDGADGLPGPPGRRAG